MNSSNSTAAVAATHNNNDNNSSDEVDLPLGALWDTLHDEFTNMGNALKCPLCLCTYQDAVLLPCVHAYCKSCLQESLAQKMECPTCKTKATRRSIAPAPILNDLAKAYKLALRHFGLAPVQFDPTYNAMTQIAPDEASNTHNNSNSLGLTLEPYYDSSKRRKSHNVIASHTQLLVSKTWQKVLQERQREAEAFVQARKKKTTTTNTTNIGSHDWYQKQQEAVSKSHQRVLLDAVRKRTEPSPALNLSMRQEEFIMEGLDFELENRFMEEENEEWERLEEEREQKEKEEAKKKWELEMVEEEEEQQEEDQKPAAVDSQPDMNRNDDSKPAVAAANTSQKSAGTIKTTGTATQDFFTPREADSQPPNTQGAALSLLDLSLIQHETNNNNHYLETATLDQDPTLSMADSFDTANSKLQEASQEQNKGKDETVPPRSTESTAETKTDRTPLQSNTISRIGHESKDSNTINNDTNSIRPNGNKTDNSTSSENGSTSSPNDVPFPRAVFQVGSLVLVQDRTWSGINKPGGIARVTKVADASSCHVEYILGGREKNVDFVYLSRPPEEMDWVGEAAATRRGRKSKRLSTKIRVKAEKSAEVEAALPRELIEQLAKEGFDVTSVVAAKQKPSVSSRGRAVRKIQTKSEACTKRTRSESRTRAQPKHAPKDRSKSEGGQARNTTVGIKVAPKRRGRSKPMKKAPVLQNQSAAKQEKKDDQARNKPSSASEKAQNAPAKRRKIVVTKTTEMPPSASKLEICSLADGHYRQRIQEHLDTSGLCVITSGLSEADKSALKSLCKALKRAGKGQVKQSEVFHPQKTSLCILSAAPLRDDPSNLVGQCRTIKAMMSALHGVPLVNASWIATCRDQQQLLMPSDSMWIRSLPVKGRRGVADYGVSKMAVQTSILGSRQVLQNFTAHLCGIFSRPPKADVLLLLREAGAEVSLSNQSTIAFLEHMEAGSSLVLICDDNCASINSALYHQIESTLKEYKAKEIYVVNPQWLFDSISAGAALPMASYSPAKANGQPAALWKALQP